MNAAMRGDELFVAADWPYYRVVMAFTGVLSSRATRAVAAANEASSNLLVLRCVALRCGYIESDSRVLVWIDGPRRLNILEQTLG